MSRGIGSELTSQGTEQHYSDRVAVEQGMALQSLDGSFLIKRHGDVGFGIGISNRISQTSDLVLVRIEQVHV